MWHFLYKLYNRDKMLTEELVELPPREVYSEMPKECVFIGAKIKNLYDENRICIQDTYGSNRYRIEKLDQNFLGIVKEIKPEHLNLVNRIKQQKSFDLIGYNLLLNDFKLACNECYFNLQPPIYPVDNHFIRKYISDFDFEKFICFNPEIPKFQAFASLNLLFVVQD